MALNPARRKLELLCWNIRERSDANSTFQFKVEMECSSTKEFGIAERRKGKHVSENFSAAYFLFPVPSCRKKYLCIYKYISVYASLICYCSQILCFHNNDKISSEMKLKRGVAPIFKFQIFYYDVCMHARKNAQFYTCVNITIE